MNVTKYDKLIRDRIPEIIEKSGKQCHTEVMSFEKYKVKLVEKFNEEIDELKIELADNSIEKAISELADIEEIVLALVKSLGVNILDFEKIREEKKQKNGGFENKLLLKEVIENN